MSIPAINRRFLRCLASCGDVAGVQASVLRGMTGQNSLNRKNPRQATVGSPPCTGARAYGRVAARDPRNDASAKRELVAKQRPSDWTPPSILRSPEALTEADVVEAETELRALQRHALEVIEPEADS